MGMQLKLSRLPHTQTTVWRLSNQDLVLLCCTCHLPATCYPNYKSLPRTGEINAGWLSEPLRLVPERETPPAASWLGTAAPTQQTSLLATSGRRQASLMRSGICAGALPKVVHARAPKAGLGAYAGMTAWFMNSIAFLHTQDGCECAQCNDGTDATLRRRNEKAG